MPPINAASSLLAQQPLQALPTQTPDISDSSGSFLSFDTFELQQALTRSRQQAASLRRPKSRRLHSRL